MHKDLRAKLTICIPTALALTLVLGLSAFAVYRSSVNHALSLAKSRDLNTVHSVTELMQYEFEDMIADIRLLAQMQESQQVFTSSLTANLAKNLLYFSLDKKSYDIIHYLNSTGMEIFRIDYHGGTPKVVDKHKLENKSTYTYFKHSQKLHVGEVYISPLMLDTESSRSTSRPKPIIHLAAPLFAEDGGRYGVIMLNFFGNHLRRIMKTDGRETNPMLLNDEGYWLRSDKTEDEWGFMHAGREEITFRSRFPAEWERIKPVGKGQFHTANGLFTYATFDPGELIADLAGIKVRSDAGRWTILTHVPETILMAEPNDYFIKILTVTIPLGCILMLSAYFICQFRQKSKKAQLDIIEQHASYARFVPREFLHLLGKGRYRDVTLDNHATREMTVLFSDIRSYTKLSESMTHLEVIQFLNKYFVTVNTPITKNKGFIDSFHGDALMALFEDNATEGAVKAAIGMQHCINELNKERFAQGEQPVAAGIGLHHGELTLGALGTDKRMQATVIGDVVNLSARIESLTKSFGVKIVISDSVYDKLTTPETFNLREIDTVRVKGKQVPVVLYEVFDTDPEELIVQKKAILPLFSQGLTLYKQGGFEKAAEIFSQCMQACPEDTISPIFFTRCKTMARIPPGDGWTGISTI
ncbi:adenylate/guanylate cyclase domain-containing protein [Pseudodesulfovibrio sediminis]|uniref:Guanylate cyclase domain-containing protein n=1 Tax=Pseudodesulfovibrio sediminis TaxID=2810563 RepID=A0ABN6EU83_9BACT|nr:adenylate/guanylate cyclase domain-containing protein [Pseudodesulfovibrio sediminis]BCS88614.1 hypothetical protein PSDVSF_18560 [Pseudodesulfovibrio sediminis]